MGWPASALRHRRSARCVMAVRGSRAALASSTRRRILGDRERRPDALDALPGWRRRCRGGDRRGDREDEVGDDIRGAIRRDLQQTARACAAVRAADRGRPPDHRQRRRADAQASRSTAARRSSPAAVDGACAGWDKAVSEGSQGDRRARTRASKLNARYSTRRATTGSTLVALRAGM